MRGWCLPHSTLDMIGKSCWLEIDRLYGWNRSCWVFGHPFVFVLVGQFIYSMIGINIKVAYYMSIEYIYAINIINMTWSHFFFCIYLWWFLFILSSLWTIKKKQPDDKAQSNTTIIYALYGTDLRSFVVQNKSEYYWEVSGSK